MTDKQIWQTIALDLKRAANYLAVGSQVKADFFLAEAINLYSNQKLIEPLKKIEPYIKFTGHPEDILLSSTLIYSRIS